MTDWSYDAWPSGEPYDWSHAARGNHPDDLRDYHVDLGCGTVKKGRIGIDRYPAPGVNIVADLDHELGGWIHSVAEAPGEDAPWPGNLGGDRRPGLPFDTSSIESIYSHHALEHIGEGFLPLMDECYRVLKPGAPFRIVVPLFPSSAAVEDPDHCRYFMEGTFDSFCGTPDHIWLEAFSVPYTKARFQLTAKDYTALLPPEKRWTPEDRRELRVTLRAVK